MAMPVPYLRLGLTFAAMLGCGVAAQARQEQVGQPQDASSASRTQAVQIGDALPASRRDTGKAYLDTTPAPPRPRPAQAESSQIPGQSGNAPTRQISSTDLSSPGVAQLSKADLEATLAQLTAAERRVLLQAIEGSDICDNPPRIPAVVALCQNRIESRSGDFAKVESEPSAEEALLRNNVEQPGLPSVSQVIDRLARASAATNDFSNQAIASIALATPAAPPARPEQDDPTAGLSDETQAMVNAIINQLGVRGP